MSRNFLDPIVRAGRPANLSKVLAQCNADAERMRAEAARRAASDKPAPVAIKPKEPTR